jgi:hypothetical protein
MQSKPYLVSAAKQAIGKPSAHTAGQKVFDLHLEIGTNPKPVSGFYALTILGANGIKFEGIGSSPAEAIAKLSLDMEKSGMWGAIASNPGVTPFPFPAIGGPPAAVPVASTAKPPAVPDPNTKKQQPSYLAGEPKGQCEALCLSYENFGQIRCSMSVCAGKK